MFFSAQRYCEVAHQSDHSMLGGGVSRRTVAGGTEVDGDRPESRR
jgi:hypothetical protein